MKHLLFWGGLGLALLSWPAQAQMLTPADTLADYTQMVGIISESLCSKLLAASTRPDYQQLSEAQSNRLMNRLSREIALENQQQLEALRKRIRARSRKNYFQLLGRAGLLRMAETCPAAPRLLADLYAKALADKSPIGEQEQATLLLLATDVCHRLTAAGQPQLLESRPVAEGRAIVLQTIREVVLARAPELTRYYGEGIMADEDRLGNVCQRMSLLLIGLCPKYVLMLSSYPDTP